MYLYIRIFRSYILAETGNILVFYIQCLYTVLTIQTVLNKGVYNYAVICRGVEWNFQTEQVNINLGVVLTFLTFGHTTMS